MLTKLDEEIVITGDRWASASITFRLRDVEDLTVARRFVEEVSAFGRRLHLDLVVAPGIRQSVPEASGTLDPPEDRPAAAPLQEPAPVATGGSLADHPATPPDTFSKVGREGSIDEIRSIDDRSIVAGQDGDEVTEDHAPDTRVFRKGESWDPAEDLVLIERDSPSEAVQLYHARFPNSLRPDGAIKTRWYGLTALVSQGGFDLDDIVDVAGINKRGRILKFNKYVPGEALVSFLDGPGVIWARIENLRAVEGGA